MKLSELLNQVQVLSQTAAPELEVGGVSCDSRRVKPGDIYVAVRGYQTDGHRYIPDAVQRGAIAVVCEEAPETQIPYVLVSDSRAALADLGAAWYRYPAREMTMIGVTGTNGKTTVTYLLKSVLEQTLGAKVGLIGTIQNMIGGEVLETERTTPESVEVQALLRRMADAGCTHVVMEVSSHALVLQRVRNIGFRLGIFTNLTQDHLDFHGTMEEYRKAKALLFQNCEIGLLNADDAATEKICASAKCPCSCCGLRTSAELMAKDPAYAADSVSFTAVEGESEADVRLEIPGTFSVYNALSVIAGARALGISLEACADALRQARGVKGRVEVVPTPGKDYTVLIDYAHTPDGLENVLSSIKKVCKGRLIAVFGCGGDRDATKRPIMGEIGVRFADLVVFTSDNPRTEDPHEILRQVVAGADGSQTPYEVIENRRAAIRRAMDLAQKDDVIVLAGKGHETYQILGTEKTHLDEREEVAAHLNGK
ncbi:MAG: UDP-N-acetylmuramoyl-L-alanyl-D-glutamate--2,6-diaminopimelate ligase [Oscillospiraceae bacterium]|nr:UDP-N-acetylmuramoyl-L-alanyl-D-glutamate--2,6-diaminopimelate ligase [Oscillospiraceae bacterium]